MAISATAALWFLPFVLPICLYAAFTDMKQMRITNQAVLVLIAIFVQNSGTRPNGTPIKHYYAVESVGLASGILITGLHHSGLATLTHTPSPMRFLNEILGRPANERPFLLLVVGYPADNVEVPDIGRKSLNDYVTSF